MEPILTKADVITVFGVSTDVEKYGYKVFFDLLKAGYNVFAIHPAGGVVDGQPRYQNLKDLPHLPTLAILVIPPSVGFSVLKDCVLAGIKKFWLQPGSESDEMIKYCQDNNLQCVYNACVMIRK